VERNFFLAGIFAMFILFVLWAPEFTAGKITITGTVHPKAFDANDNISAVSIETKDGPYTVTKNAIGKRMLKLVGKNISITGIVGEDSMGNTTITVKTYEIIE
jgi:hypothetical protein